VPFGRLDVSEARTAERARGDRSRAGTGEKLATVERHVPGLIDSSLRTDR
jgi:hypothetical protein